MEIALILIFIGYLYIIWLFIMLMGISDVDYKKHRNLIMHPENDPLNDTMTSISMGKDGNLIIRKRVSIGATKRFLNKSWE